ncbi:unnamed protein product, partial [Schistosoma haematobium]
MINLPCFGDATEVGKFISHLHTELENNCRTYEAVYKSLCESRTSSNVDETVIHDPSSCPEMSNSETFPVVGSNSTVPETCTDSDVPSSQEEDLILNARKCIAVPVHKETENESGSILNPAVPNGPHHSAIKVSDESYCRNSVLPENMTDASNGQKSNTILIDAVYFSDLLSTNGILKRSNEYVSQKSKLNDLISSVADPHRLVSSSGPSTQCGKYALNRIRLTVTW